MNDCPSCEEIPEWATAQPGDARRDHVDECPRCRSWWLEYQDFESQRLPASLSPREVRDAVEEIGFARPPLDRSPALRRSWWIAACLPLLLAGAWWGSTLLDPSPPRWRGGPEVGPQLPFDVAYQTKVARIEGVGAEVQEIRWLWLGSDLGSLGEKVWHRDVDFQSTHLSLEVGPAPPASRYWQVEWSDVSGHTASGPLTEVQPADQP